MAPYRTNRSNLLSKFRKPYAKKRKLSRSVTISEGGVGGALAIMRPAPLPPPQEIKYFDSTGSGVIGTPLWSIISSASVHGITIGGGPSQRIGKNIRVVGLVFRATVQTDVAIPAAGTAVPFTMDFILDRQCNGLLATAAEMYSTSTGNSLPNPLYDTRFKFLKRVANKNPNSPYTQVDFNIKMNELFEFKDTSGTIADLSTKNIYVSYVSPADAASGVNYYMRVLYVDA